MSGGEWDDAVDCDLLLFGGKTCPTCGETKPRSSEHFHRDAETDDGYTRECAACRVVRARQRYRVRRAS